MGTQLDKSEITVATDLLSQDMTITYECIGWNNGCRGAIRTDERAANSDHAWSENHDTNRQNSRLPRFFSNLYESRPALIGCQNGPGMISV